MRNIEHLPHYTYQDYKSWKGQWELIYGIPYAMSPSAKKNHNRLGGNIFTYIKSNLNCTKCEVYYETDWIIADDSIVRPDILIVCDDIESDWIETTPVLIIEILSESTAIKDKNVKFSLYQENGVKFYILINPINYEIEIFELIDNKYVLNNSLEEYIFSEACSLSMNVKNVL